ncbi:hypothetical protein [Roseimicrobium sp. ORNL1]|uniref:hypothetical protein n=1 Tax=Roseimicrobium sp. ORNL1 TaxID=2711231 RepID=UPI0013E1FFD7|nr:hypothetical protein [Roseimicrobium sp. ORNL1]QIF04882.1 hypothetical protein G5S37_26325 [Roseimicrobium sp. ORNL1]
MHCHATRNRAFPAALAIFLFALMGNPTTSLAQQTGRRTIQPNQPGQFTPTRPTIVIPSRPTIVTPQRPTVVQPAQPVIRNNPLVGRPLPTGRPITSNPISPGVSPGLRPQPGPTFPVKPVPPIAILPPVVKPVPPIGNLPPPSWWKPSPPCFLPPPCLPPPCPVAIVIPSFPSAFIGPEIVSITTYPTEMDTGFTNIPAPAQEQMQMQPGDPAALQGNEATPRLIAILGRIERVDTSLPSTTSSPSSPAAGTSTDRDGDQLCIGVATLTTYFNPDPDLPAEAMARGSYFGSRWDGDTWHTSATGLWSRGPVTRQPLFTLHELQPSAFPFEVALPGRRITSLRMAIALVRDTASPPLAPSPQPASRSTLPLQSKLRHLTMANNLRRHLQDSNEPVPLVPLIPPPSSSSSFSSSSSTPTPPELDPSQTYLGNANSPFSQALSDSLQDLLTTSSLPQPSSSVSGNQPSTINQGPSTTPVSGYQPSTKDHQLIGSAEWTLPLSDLRDIMSGCPRFTTIPLPADLQTVRSRDTSPAPLWVRPFRIEVGAQSESSSGYQPPTLNHQPTATYQGEVWFLIVPDWAQR